jgi:hypothetical protein
MPPRTLVKGLPLALASILIAACGGATPIVSDGPNGTQAAVVTPSPIASPIATPSPTPSARPTAAPTHSPRPTPSPSPAAASLASGLTGKVALPEYGFTIVLPKGWKTIGLTTEDVDAIFKAIPAGMIPAGIQDRLPELAASGLKLWAFDSSKAGAGASVNVVAAPGRMALDTLEMALKSRLATITGVSGVTTRRVTIDGLECLRVDFTISATVNGRTLTLTETQISIPRPTAILGVTIALKKGTGAAARDAIVKSIQLH